jgi:hypothetical protein
MESVAVDACDSRSREDPKSKGHSALCGVVRAAQRQADQLPLTCLDYS